MAKKTGDSNKKDKKWHKRTDITVDANQEPLRIDKFLTIRLERTARSKIQKHISEGMILVNGDTIKSNYKVRPRDEIEVFTTREPVDTRVIPEDIPVDIRYEDEDIIVVHKPAGIVVHPANGHYSGTLLNGLAWHLGYRSQEGITPEIDRFGLVHRIDKDTSGLLVVGKTEQALNHLAKQF
ncbi:MAG TPA: RluA family pseudouridine synthase, partial [Chitinophagaceae bacterium]|nr:RluA family pseudouridine synthase [Chitinophagaceae bacterium]